MDRGQWTQDDGQRTMDRGQWTVDIIPWTLDRGHLVVESGKRKNLKVVFLGFGENQ